MTAVAPPVMMTARELLATLPGHEDRPEQDRLIDQVEASAAAGRSLAAQAGTGTGKSFSGLIPAIRRALGNGETVLIATATKALQGQYTTEDLPFLAEHLGLGFTFAELKGKSNYVCAAKLAEAEGPAADAMRRFLEDHPGHSGDFARIPAEVLADSVTAELATGQDECPGRRDCLFGEDCFAYQAKDRAATAHIIVVNHALLAMDLKLKVERVDEQTKEPTGELKSVLLPEYDHVVIDEAHNFEAYVTSMCGSQLSVGTFRSLAAEVASFTGSSGGELTRVLLGSADKLFENLAAAFPSRYARSVELTHEKALSMDGLFRTLSQELSNMRSAVVATEVERASKRATQKTRLLKKLTTAQEKIDVLSPQSQGSVAGEVVRWISREERRNGVQITVGYSPLSVANFLRERLWADTTGLLMSATLRPNNDPSFVPGRLGLDDYDAFDAGTPFNYLKQAGVFIPESLNPSEDEGRWMAVGNQLITDLVRTLGGRTMILFTSRKNMMERYNALHESFEAYGFPCYVQRAGEPVDALIAAKKAQPHSVLFGLKSLMEGVDIKGMALEAVVIDKLPFDPPDDVVPAARGRKMDAALIAKGMDERQAKFHKRGSFNGLAVPTMALLLEQAFGRLIRTTTDRGIVMIMDNRLHPTVGKGYGKKTFDNLPACRFLRDRKEMLGYAAKIAARHPQVDDED